MYFGHLLKNEVGPLMNSLTSILSKSLNTF